MAHLELSSTDIAAFTVGFSGAVIGPDAEGYDAARHVWNGMIDRYPALIVRPRTTDDVAAGTTFFGSTTTSPRPEHSA